MKQRLLVILGVLLCGIAFAYAFVVVPPKRFPVNVPFSVESGDTLSSVSRRLESEGYIASRVLFEGIVILLDREHKLSAGEYAFDRAYGPQEIARRITYGVFGVRQYSLTIPEGFTRADIARVADQKLPAFDAATFMELTKDMEGRLFPDTYFFLKNATEEDVVRMLRATFEAKTKSVQEQAKAEGVSFEDILIMASIVEKEAFGNDDREEIAAILWRRIREGKLLQVDAPFLFILGKGSSELTLTDLKVQSPYNTYIHKGLPPGPIGNPGLLAIKAAMTHKDSKYLFYLHDDRGTIHYAATFDEHRKNIARYLK